MSIIVTNNKYYNDIAEVIRSKLNVDTKYKPNDMAAAIQNISTSQGVPVTFTGNPVVATGTIANQPFAGLKIYGKSTQDGTPSPSNPVPIVNAGASGSIALSITDGADQSQSLTISTTNGLPGIPVDSGGNYIDASGQRWICDVVDFGLNQKTEIVSKVLLKFNIDEDITPTHEENYTSFYIYHPIEGIPIPKRPSHIAISNFFGNAVDCRIELIDWNIYVRFPTESGINTKEQFLQFFENNEVYIIYISATPVTTPLSDEELAAYRSLTTYANTTVISTAENVAGMEATVYCDTGKIIQNQQNEIDDMNDAVNLLLGI